MLPRFRTNKPVVANLTASLPAKDIAIQPDMALYIVLHVMPYCRRIARSVYQCCTSATSSAHLQVPFDCHAWPCTMFPGQSCDSRPQPFAASSCTHWMKGIQMTAAAQDQSKSWVSLSRQGSTTVDIRLVTSFLSRFSVEEF